MRLAAFVLLATSTLAAYGGSTTDVRLAGSYRHNEAGWTYVHLTGTPEQVGFQHGYLLAKEIDDNVHVYAVEAPNLDQHDWAFFREAGKTMLWPHLNAEYQAELKGMAEGLRAAGSKTDLWDLVAVNGDLELTDYWLPWKNAQEKKANPPAATAPGKCSAFIATGSATKDGKIVIAHSNWSTYAEGERWNSGTPFGSKPEAIGNVVSVIIRPAEFTPKSSWLVITPGVPSIMKWNPCCGTISKTTVQRSPSA